MSSSLSFLPPFVVTHLLIQEVLIEWVVNKLFIIIVNTWSEATSRPQQTPALLVSLQGEYCKEPYC